MKHRFLFIMALLLTAATGAWAQDPAPIDLTPSADGTEWTLASTPDYDVELEVTYYTDEELAALEEAAYTAGVELTKTGTNEWTLAATPSFGIELEVEYETALALNETDDNTEKLTEWNGCEADVTLTRTLTAGQWNTMAAPFGISTSALAAIKQVIAANSGSITVKELASADLDANSVLTLTFQNATEIKAGQPYLVKVSNNLSFATLPTLIAAAVAGNLVDESLNPFKGAIISKTAVPFTSTYVDFIPTLGKTLMTGPEGDLSNANAVLFLGTGNTLYHPKKVNDQEATNDSYLKGFRAYFQLKGDAVKARKLILNYGDETVTGIINVNGNGNVNGNWYDLQGRKVNGQWNKKVYIIKGKKVIK